MYTDRKSYNMTTMIRVSRGLNSDLKQLKDTMVKPGSSSDVLHLLIQKELMKTHAQTNHGFLPVGSVVNGPEGKPLVIGNVSRNEVVFTDGSYVLNGSAACSNLEFLAESIDKFDGGLLSV